MNETEKVGLIGREVWYCTGHFVHGRVVKENGGMVIVQGKFRDYECATGLLLYSAEEAKSECQENVTYWKNKLKELEAKP